MNIVTKKNSVLFLLIALAVFLGTGTLAAPKAHAAFQNNENANGLLGQADQDGNPIYTGSELGGGPNPNGFDAPFADALDTINHRLFVVDQQNNRILVFQLSNSNSVATTTAAYVLGQSTFSGAASATTQNGLNDPYGVAFDPNAERLFVSEAANNRVLVFDVAPADIHNGENAENVLGQSDYISGGTGAVSSSTFDFPKGIAYDPSNKRLFVGDTSNHRVLIFDVATSSIMNGEGAENVLGQPDFDSSAFPFPITSSTLNVPSGVAYDGVSNRAFVVDSASNRVLVFDVATSTITDDEGAVHVLGQSTFDTGSPDGSAAGLGTPGGVTYDPVNKRLFVEQPDLSNIVAFDVATGTIADGESASYVIGQIDFGDFSSGNSPSGVNEAEGAAYDPVNNQLIVADTNNNRILFFDVSALSSGEAADGLLGHSDQNGDPEYFLSGPNNNPNPNGFGGVTYTALDTVNHRLFVSDTSNSRILVYNLNSSNAIVSNTPAYVLGQADFYSITTSTLTANTMLQPEGLAYDPANDRLFVADAANNRVLMFDVAPTDIHDFESASSVLGETDFLSNDFGSSSSTLSGPIAVAYDSTNNRLFVGDNNNCRVMVFDVGTGSFMNGEGAENVLGEDGSFDPSGCSTSQNTFSGTINGLAYDSGNGRLFVADSNNNRVLFFDVAPGDIMDGENADYVIGQGNYTDGFANIGQSSLNSPQGLAYDPTGSRLFVADSNDHRVLEFNVAPSHTAQFPSFNQPAEAELGQVDFNSSTFFLPQQNTLNNLGGLDYDPGSSTLFVVDSGNSRVLTFDAPSGPSIALTASSLNLTAPHGGTSTNEGPQSIVLTNNGDFGDTLNWTSSSTASWLTINPSSGSLAVSATTTLTLTANPTGLGPGIYDATATIADPAAANSPQTVSVAMRIAGADSGAVGLLGQVDQNGNPVYNAGGLDNAPNGQGFSQPSFTALDPINHRLFVSDTQSNRVLVFNLTASNGVSSTSAAYVLGQPSFASTTVNDPSMSSLVSPEGLAYDSAGNRLFVSDLQNRRIMVFDVTPADIHNGENAEAELGQADFTAADFNDPSSTTIQSPEGLAYDSANQRLFAADGGFSRVLVYNVASITNDQAAVHVLGQPDFVSNNSNTSSSTLNFPVSVTYDPANDRLFVVDQGNQRVLMFDADPLSIMDGEPALSVLGEPDFDSINSGTSSSTFENPTDTAFDTAGNRLFVSDESNQRVMVFDVGTSTFTNGEPAVHVLGQDDFDSVNSVSSENTIGLSGGLAYDSANQQLFVVDSSNNQVVVFGTASISDGEAITTLLGHNDKQGNPIFGNTGEYNAPNDEGLDDPSHTALDTTNHRLFVSDSGNNRVLVFNLAADNTISTNLTSAAYVLGQPNLFASVASTSQVNTQFPKGLAYDAADDRLFVADANNNRVLMFDVDPETIASGEGATSVLGQIDFTSENSGTSSSTFSSIGGLAYDPDNHRLFVSDSGNNRVLAFNVGTSTFTNGEGAVGVLGQMDFDSVDISDISSSSFSDAGYLAYDSTNERLFVGDNGGNARVLVFDVGSSTFTNGEGAENVLGAEDFSTDGSGQATQNSMGNPGGLAYDPTDQELFVADGNNNRVLVFDVSTGDIMNGENASNLIGQVYFDDRTSRVTQNGLNDPQGVTYNPTDSDVFVADAGNNRVADFSLGTTAAAQISLSTPSISYTATTGATSPDQGIENVTITNDGGTDTTLNWSISSNESWLTFSSASGALAQNATSSVGLIVNPSSLGTGIFYATATVSDAGASNSPQFITVQLTTTAASGGGGGNVSVGVSSGGGGGGGGGSYIPPTAPTSTAPVLPPTSTAGLTAAQLQALILQLTTQIQSLETRLAATQGSGGSGGGTGNSAEPTAPTTGAFLKNLQLGIVSPDVKRLQDFLNTHGFPVAPKGRIGAPGRETEYFWIATQAAVIKYQKAAGIVPASGYFGPLTRAYVNKVLAGE